MIGTAIVTLRRLACADIVYYEDGFGTSYPVRRYGVRLPSGMIHSFETERDALHSPYTQSLPPREVTP